MSSPASSPDSPWLFVNWRVLESASGLRGRDLYSLHSRLYRVAEERDGIFGRRVEGEFVPSIALQLPDSSGRPSHEIGFARLGGEDDVWDSGSSSAVLLFFDYWLFREATGFRGCLLESSWARLWGGAEACAAIGGYWRPYVALEVLELRPCGLSRPESAASS